MNLLNIGEQEIIVILIIVLVLFGGKKIPELMRGLGKGVKEYKKAVNDIDGEIDSVAAESKKPRETTTEKPKEE